MKKPRHLRTAVIIALLAIISMPLSAATINIAANRPGADIAPTFIGLFIEDINFNGDGGLYTERVKNRSFEFPDAMMGWSTVKKGDAAGSAVAIHKQDYEPADTSCLRIDVDRVGDGFGVANEGFRGMGIEQGQKYYFSVYARTEGSPKSLKIQALSPDDEVVLEGQLDNITGDWKHYNILCEAGATALKARLNVLAQTQGVIDLDMISLFPELSSRQMYGRPVPGIRTDLVKLMDDVNPGFLRFPGGCIVEGRTLDVRYQWKKTVGDLDDRTTIINRWNTEFNHRLTPDYYQSFGLGFFEYFLLSEQIGAEPMPIINCGMACQFNTGETVALNRLEPYVQDALDLIEFANGPANTRWGRLRAQMGHPEPFNMKYLGVGNEQWGPQYIERYKIFEQALKDEYPEVKLVVATGSDATIFPNGQAEIEYLWSQWRQLKPDIVDEHFYRRYPWFFENTEYYDDYDSDGPEIFVGEYAAMSEGVASPENKNNLICALAEAAFLTGMERNARVVTMSSYAPMAGHVEGWQWKPNLFWFDNLTSYGTPNYYVQKMFGVYRGDKVLPLRTAGDEERLYTCASLDSNSNHIYVKVVNAGTDAVNTTIRLRGVEQIASEARVVTLAGRPNDENSIANPKKIAPVEKIVELETSGSQFEFTVQPCSFTVIEIEPMSI